MIRTMGERRVGCMGNEERETKRLMDGIEASVRSYCSKQQ